MCNHKLQKPLSIHSFQNIELDSNNETMVIWLHVGSGGNFQK